MPPTDRGNRCRAEEKKTEKGNKQLSKCHHKFVFSECLSDVCILFSGQAFVRKARYICRRINTFSACRRRLPYRYGTLRPVFHQTMECRFIAHLSECPHVCCCVCVCAPHSNCIALLAAIFSCVFLSVFRVPTSKQRNR